MDNGTGGSHGLCLEGSQYYNQGSAECPKVYEGRHIYPRKLWEAREEMANGLAEIHVIIKSP